MAKRAFDAESARADFPVLARQVYGKPLHFLDTAASAQKPQAVIDAVSDAYARRIRQHPSRRLLPVAESDGGLRRRAREDRGVS